MSFDFKVEKHSNLTPAAERQKILDNPAWGRNFSDHMVTIRYSEEKGWHDGKIGPRNDLPFDPATMVFHYALQIFEGMKAYSTSDGGATLFRPLENAKRFRKSAERLAMAQLPEDTFVEAVKALVSIDREWIPTSEGSSLYLRPFLLGTEVALGTKPSSDYLFAVVACPVASYFKNGVKPVSVWVSDNFTRAAPGGTGAAKCGGNYAAALAAQAEGLGEDCEQVVFLDAVERRWIEELAGMNVFFVFKDGSLQTPPLTGTILPGITRNSLITLAREQGRQVREEQYSIDQWQEDAKSGRLVEAFACGTAAVIAPIGRIKGRNHEFVIGEGVEGEVTKQMRSALTDIQFSRVEDTHQWLERVL